MILSWFVASLHFLTLAFGATAIAARGIYFKQLADLGFSPTIMKKLFVADNMWGLAAILWIVTGLLRVFAGLEKGQDYYLHNTFFWLKMISFLIVVALEIKPMVQLIKWRTEFTKSQKIDLANVDLKMLARLNHIEIAMFIPIVFFASAMAKGLSF